MATKAELIQRCEELGIDTEPLTNNEQREAAIAAKEAELAAEATAGASETTEEKPAETPEEDAPEGSGEGSEDDSEEQEEKPDHYEDDLGRKWKFKSSAPKTINIDGHPRSQEEILEAEEIISELVYGNCSFLTQIH